MQVVHYTAASRHSAVDVGGGLGAGARPAVPAPTESFKSFVQAAPCRGLVFVLGGIDELDIFHSHTG